MDSEYIFCVFNIYPIHVPVFNTVDPKGLWHIGEAESCKALERYQTIKQFNALV